MSPADPLVTRIHAVYMEIPKENLAKAVKRLRDAYDSVYQIDPHLFLVKTSDLSNTVAEKVGIKGENRIVSGVVFRLNGVHAGFYRPDLWDWLG